MKDLRVSLNMDVGEFPDEPAAFYSLATHVNIACGGHAGDVESMARGCRLARDFGANVFAHPSYPDRVNFGRTSLPNLGPNELMQSLRDQFDLLTHVAAKNNVPVVGIKVHGALYHDLSTQHLFSVGHELLAFCRERGLAMVALAGSQWALRVGASGVPLIREGFADRGYTHDHQLISRHVPGALLDPSAATQQAEKLARQGLCDTLCVHGDGPSALETAQRVREMLESTGLLRR